MNTIFWQWFNQTYNAGLNYGNRNPTSPNTIKDLFIAYCLAVSSSIVVSLGLKKLSVNYTKHLKGGSAILAHSLITFSAVATAGFLNCTFMRMGEISSFRGKLHTELRLSYGVLRLWRLSDPLRARMIGVLFICAVAMAIWSAMEFMIRSIAYLLSNIRAARRVRSWQQDT